MTKTQRQRLQTLSYALGVTLVGMLVLLWGVGHQASAYHSVAQVVHTAQLCDNGCYLGGIVQKQSLTLHQGDVRFSIQDERSDTTMLVEYRGSLPSMFQEGRVVLVQGYLHQGQINALNSNHL